MPAPPRRIYLGRAPTIPDARQRIGAEFLYAGDIDDISGNKKGGLQMLLDWLPHRQLQTLPACADVVLRGALGEGQVVAYANFDRQGRG